VLAALLRIGWVLKRQVGSHRTLSRMCASAFSAALAICFFNRFQFPDCLPNPYCDDHNARRIALAFDGYQSLGVS
jgi:hypothetical protein